MASSAAMAQEVDPTHGAGNGSGADTGDVAIPVLLLVAGLAVLAVSQGGFYWRARTISELLVGASGVAFVATTRRSRTSSAATLTGLGALAASTLVTGFVSGHPSGLFVELSVIAAAAVIVYVVAGLAAAGRDQLQTLVTYVAVFLAITAWLGVAFHISPLAHVDGGLWRAATTITYANASAAALTIAALLALSGAIERPDPVRRLLSAAVLTGLAATLSRAGIGALIGGLLILAFLVGPARVITATWPSVLGAAIAFIGLLPGSPSPGPAQPAWAIAGLVAGLGLAVAPWPPKWTHPSTGRSRLGRSAIVAALVGVALLAGLAIGLAQHSSVWSARLSLASPDRHSANGAAWKLFADHPLVGVGPGQAVLLWTEPGGRLVIDHYAHDEYLQVAAEQGALGLAALVALIGGVAWTARRGWRTGPTLVRAGAIAGLCAFAVHSGFDFLWHVPIVTFLAAVAIGLASPLPATGSKEKPNPTEEIQNAS